MKGPKILTITLAEGQVSSITNLTPEDFPDMIKALHTIEAQLLGSLFPEPAEVPEKPLSEK